MSLHIDVPTRSEVVALLEAKRPGCVSIYMPTTPVTSDVEAERIEFKNAIGEAMERVEALELERGDADRIREPLEALLDDDGFWAYQMAVVVDDADQGVTHVVRGADLLDSTARQIYLQRLLALPTPQYMHVPVVTNAAGEKLSKQTGALALDLQRPVEELMAAARFLELPVSTPASIDDFWAQATAVWRAAHP